MILMEAQLVGHEMDILFNSAVSDNIEIGVVIGIRRWQQKK
jgi:hypothetical protein